MAMVKVNKGYNIKIPEDVRKKASIIEGDRILHFFENGAGDYTIERMDWIDDTSIQNIVKEIKEKRE